LKCSACQNEIEFNIDYFPHLSSGLMADKWDYLNREFTNLPFKFVSK
jgi:hypothetical protein